MIYCSIAWLLTNISLWSMQQMLPKDWNHIMATKDRSSLGESVPWLEHISTIVSAPRKSCNIYLMSQPRVFQASTTVVLLPFPPEQRDMLPERDIQGRSWI